MKFLNLPSALLVSVVGRPASGKTSQLLRFSKEISRNNKLRFFSKEVDDDSLGRGLSMFGCNMTNIDTGIFDFKYLNEKQFYIIDYLELFSQEKDIEFFIKTLKEITIKNKCTIIVASQAMRVAQGQFIDQSVNRFVLQHSDVVIHLSCEHPYSSIEPYKTILKDRFCDASV